MLTFITDDFSPFTIEYVEKAPVVVAPGTPELPEVDEPDIDDETGLPEGMPVAKIVDLDEWENVAIKWEGFGGLNPADLAQKLETVYTFSCPEGEYDTKYDSWWVDFVVSMDRDVPLNAVTLGGNYGSWGWVGFENDQPVDKDLQVALLAYASDRTDGMSGWTYADIKSGVNTFFCGVARANGAYLEDGSHVLDGATITVRLRLTNPENHDEYYDVNVVTYTFGATEAAE